MVARRKCAFFECKSKTGFHAFPKDFKRALLWLRAMGRSSTTDTKDMFVCNKHFSVESYDNYNEVQLGFGVHLRLKADAVPNPADFFLTSNTYKITKDNGCQTDPQPKLISFGTQLSMRNGLVHRRSKASQTLSVSVCVAAPVHWKRPPSKRRRLKLNDVDEYDGDSTEVTDPDSTALSQASPSINDVLKYMVDEVCLLQLFEECPVCRSTCEVQKTTTGTLLTVDQLCSQCHFNRNWRSQQAEKTMPSGDVLSCTSDPERSAAAITEIIGFSDENDSSDEGSSEVDDGERNSDSDWTPRDLDKKREKDFRVHCPKCGMSFYSQKTHTCKPYSCKRKLCPEGQNEEVEDHSLSNGLDPLDYNIDDTLADEGQTSKVDDGGDHNSDSDWDPLERHNSDSESDIDDKRTDDKTSPLSPFGLFGEKLLCPECGAFFFSQTRRGHTCKHKKPYSCNVCGRRYNFEYKLKVHSKIHEDSFKYQCKYCCITFRTKHEKLAHELSHPTAEKPYQCPDCPQVFDKIRERYNHLLSHTGPKRHICHICNIDFPFIHKLERHMAVHTKAKQFVCEVCQRSFNQASHLKSHMRVHTGEKPYQCQHCDKSFNHNVSLKSHTQRYHGQVPDPGMEVQMEKTGSIEFEAEKDETNEIASSAIDGKEVEPSKDTLCNTENGSVEKEENVGWKRRRLCTGRPRGRPKKNAVITSDDVNQSKRQLCIGDENEEDQDCSDSANEEQMHDSDADFEPGNESEAEKNETNEIASSGIDAEEVEPRKDTLCNTENGGDEKEENMGKGKRCTGRPRGRPKKYAVIKSDENEEDQDGSDSADEEQMHDSDSDFVPEGWRPKKKSWAQSHIKDRGRCRGKQKKNTLV